MGDQVGQALDGILYYIPYSEFQRIRNIKLLPEKKADIFADMCRFNTLYMIACAGSGHIGSSFSSMEIFSWLLLEELRIADTTNSEGDLFFSSKGHDVPAYYSVLIGLGRLPFDFIHKLRQINGLPGHPDITTPGVVTNTGSLGMGISKAKGLVFANRLQKKSGRVFLLTGDGELQEGQIWESMISAVNHGLHEITMIIDHNKLQSDTFVKNVSDLGDLESKLRAFGWRVERCDGNNIKDLVDTLALIRKDPRPKAIIADTIKGKGVSFMEHTSLDSDTEMYRFHSGAPDAKSYQLAVQEINERLDCKLSKENIAPCEFIMVEREKKCLASQATQKLISAYSDSLILQANSNPNLVALDADLVLDTGLGPFRDQFPERFFEFGIAEQDMVSTAGGMALKGLLPVVHSFSAFLSARPNEQIYNNATEKTKIIYVGSLAGVIPGGPGHSHQAIRDISALSAIPGLTLIEPSCEREVSLLLDWCINKASGSCYIRLFSLPWEISYTLPEGYQPTLGIGVVLNEGSDTAIITYGPVLLGEALKAANILNKQNISVKIINLPWLNYVDSRWLKDVLESCKLVFCLDNHYIIGGQGCMISREIASWGADIVVKIVGIKDIPPCGTNWQVLSAISLTDRDIVEVINTSFNEMKG
ncbi:TPA: transketolase [Legionella pneumophila]|nr:transketolase [Legionella pneumophila]